MKEEEEENEEEDYMSDKFLCEAVSSSDADSKGSRKRHRQGHGQVCRGLGDDTFRARPQKRERRRVEEEKREKGLSTPLTDDNKGFSMLHRMGYRPGMGLGREGSKGNRVYIFFKNLL